jgi:hypothetical protein
MGVDLDRLSGHLWFLKAFGVFLVALCGWILLAIWTGVSFGAELSFNHDLSSHLTANYGEDSDLSVKFLSLTIFGDIFSDQELSDDSIEIIHTLLDDPVPTATMQGASGNETLPATAVDTSTPDVSTPGSTETESSLNIVIFTQTGTATPTPIYTSTPTKTYKPSATPIPTKTQTPTEALNNDVIPILDCVSYLGGGKYLAYFGYKNESLSTQQIPIGEQNRFDPIPKDRGQPTSFPPGRSDEYPNSPFSVEFDEGTELIWHLTSNSVVAKMTSPYCDPPYPLPSETPLPEDTKPPILTGGTLDLYPGPIEGCEVTVNLNTVHVEDPAFSSGISWVKIIYIIQNYSSEIYSVPLDLVSGEYTEDGGWLGYYSGSITISIDPGWVISTSESFYIELYAKAMDNVSKSGVLYFGIYMMPSSCGTPPE